MTARLMFYGSSKRWTLPRWPTPSAAHLLPSNGGFPPSTSVFSRWWSEIPPSSNTSRLAMVGPAMPSPERLEADPALAELARLARRDLVDTASASEDAQGWAELRQRLARNQNRSRRRAITRIF